MVNADDVRKMLSQYETVERPPLTVNELEKGSGITIAEVKKLLKPYGEIVAAPIKSHPIQQNVEQEQQPKLNAPWVQNSALLGTLPAQAPEARASGGRENIGGRGMGVIPQAPKKPTIGSAVNNFIVGANPIAPLMGAMEDTGALISRNAQRQMDEMANYESNMQAYNAQIKSGIKPNYPPPMPPSTGGMNNIINPFLARISQNRSELTSDMEAKKQTAAQQFKQSVPGYAGDLLLTGGEMVGAAATAATGGVPFVGLLGYESGTQAGKRALDEGYAPNKAMTLGMGAGAITAGVESLFGIAGKAGAPLVARVAKSKLWSAVASKVSPKVLESFAKWAGTKGGRITLGLIGDALGEGVEEGIEYDAQRVFENFMLDKDVERDVKQQLYSVMLGVGVGGLFGGGRALGIAAESRQIPQNPTTQNLPPQNSSLPMNQSNIIPESKMQNTQDLTPPVTSEQTQDVVPVEIKEQLRAYAKENMPDATDAEIEQIIGELEAPMQSADTAFLDRVQSKFGVEFEVRDIGVQDAEAFISGNKIILSPTATQESVVRGVVLHELTHLAETSQSYGELKQYTINQLSDFAEQTQAKMAQYKERGVELNQQQAEAEVVAEYVRNTLFADPAAIETLVAQKPTVARQLYDAIVAMIEKLKSVVTGQQLSELEQGRRLFEKALNTSQVTEIDGKYSITDSEGNTLTKQQQEYFKDSKVRDENGNLLVVYHGTDARFTEFDSKIAPQFFSASKEYSGSYGKNIMPVYLNITKPFDTRNAKDLSVFNDLFRPYAKNRFGRDVAAYNAKKLVSFVDIDTLYPFLRKMQREGNLNYDGIVVEEGIDLEDFRLSYVPLSNQQIKAIGNKAPTSNPDIRFSISNDDRAKIKAEYERLLEEYKAIKQGENPSRDIPVPQQTSDNKRVRQGVMTFAESEHFTDDMKPGFEKMIVDEALSYSPIKDDAAASYADGVIVGRGYQGALSAWDAVASGTARATKNQIVLGERLFIEAANRGDTAKALDLLAQIAVEGTNAGQTVQAFRVLKRLGKEGRILAVMQSVNKMNRTTEEKRNKKMTPEERQEVNKLKQLENELKKDPEANADAIAEIKTKISQISGELFIPQANLDEIMAIPEGNKQALDDAINRAYVEIAKQMPATWMDKWNSWRYLAMLGNPRTHIRNIAGNSIFYPARQLKNLIKAGAQNIPAYKGEKTAAILTAKDKPLKQFARQSWEEVKSDVTSGGKMNPSDIIRDHRAIFKTKLLEGARKLNFAALETEDAWFLRNAYVSSMAQYLKANNIDVQALQSDSPLARATVEKAVNYATEEALKATYRDANAISTALANLAKSSKTANVIVEGIVPFKKTPLNLIRRGIEYSPAGLVNGVLKMAKAVRNGMDATEALDDMCAGLSGTAILLLGQWMYSMGWLVGAGDEDKKKRDFEKMQGKQFYALQIGDNSFTVDWAAPISLPLFVGAEIERMRQKEEGFTFTQGIEALSTILEPMVNLSMLNGVDSAIQSAAYGEFSPLADIGFGALTSYVSQANPTLLGQMARTIDPTRRNAYYTDKTVDAPKTVQQMVDRNIAKIPFASKTLPRKIDAWGREDKGDALLERTFENFISPGYLAKKNVTPVDEEVKRLYDATGEPVLPNVPSKYFTLNKERIDVSKKDYELMAEADGRKAFELIDQVIKTKDYNSLDDAAKARVIQDIYSLSNSVGKNKIEPDYGYDKWMQQAMNPPKGVTTAEWLVLYDKHGSRLLSSKIEDAAKTVGVKSYLKYADELDSARLAQYDAQLKAKKINADEYEKLKDRGATQEEAQDYLNGLKIPKEDKAVMWYLINTGWTTNPYGQIPQGLSKSPLPKKSFPQLSKIK